METNNESVISPEESIAILNRVLEQTRFNLNENKFAFLFWGYFILIICLTQYLLIQLEVSYHFIPWLCAPLGWIVTIIYYSKKRRTISTPVFMGKTMAYVWAFAGVNMCIVGFCGWAILGSGLIGVILIIYSLSSFASGLILKFKPLIYASIMGNLLALATLLIIPAQYHLLSMALFILLCSIIPGHLFPKRN